MLTSYGHPPLESECVEGSPPDNLVVKTSPGVIPPNAPGMHGAEAMGKRVSAVAIARQLNRHYDFGRAGPVKVPVSGYGTFLLGPDGWCLERN